MKSYWNYLSVEIANAWHATLIDLLLFDLFSSDDHVTGVKRKGIQFTHDQWGSSYERGSSFPNVDTPFDVEIDCQNLKEGSTAIMEGRFKFKLERGLYLCLRS